MSNALLEMLVLALDALSGFFLGQSILLKLKRAYLWQLQSTPLNLMQSALAVAVLGIIGVEFEANLALTLFIAVELICNVILVDQVL